MSDVLVVLLVGGGSYLLRTSFIAFAQRDTISPTVLGVLDNVKPAALAALAMTAIVSHGPPPPDHIVALTITALAARAGIGLLGALLSGLSTFALLRLVL